MTLYVTDFPGACKVGKFHFARNTESGARGIKECSFACTQLCDISRQTLAPFLGSGEYSLGKYFIFISCKSILLAYKRICK